MIQFRINDQALVLYPGTEVGLEYKPTLTIDPLQDSYSLPFSAPVAGNEVAMQHAHQLALRGRPAEFPDAELIIHGGHSIPGKLLLESGTDRSYELSFIPEAFVNEILDRKLNELDLGDPIVTEDLRAYAKAVNEQSWPDAPCCFPMYAAPSFYGDENPYWYPEANEWKQLQNYAVNDFVVYTHGSPIRRAWVYQCIQASFNNRPDLSPTYWRLTAFGIVNHWDHENEEFFQNEDGENFYTMVPWFYAKHILTQALSSIGLRPVGDFMDDERTHRLVYASNTAQDLGGIEKYWHATQTADVTSDGSTAVIPAQDDSTPPNIDTDGQWNTTTMRWKCTAAGDWTLRAYFFPPLNGRTLVVRLLRDDGTVMNTFVRDGASILFGWNGLFYANLSLDAGDVNTEYYWTASWTNSTPITVSGAWVEGWRQTTSDSVLFNPVIDLREHVPDVTLDELISDLKGLFNLKVTPDTRAGVVRFDYCDNAFEQQPVEQTHRVRSPISITNRERIRGFKFLPLLEDDQLPDLAKLTEFAVYDTDADVTLPSAPGIYCYVRSTRSLYTSVRNTTTGYVWEYKGTYYEPQTIGDATAAEERSVELEVAPFTRISSNGEQFEIPLVDHQGQSKYFIQEKEPPPYLISMYHGMQPNENDVLYPLASPLAVNTVGDEVSELSLDMKDARGPVDLFWRRTAEAHIDGDIVECDMELDPGFLAERAYNQVALIHHQPMLFLELPVTLANRRGPIMASAARLLKLRQQ